MRRIVLYVLLAVVVVAAVSGVLYLRTQQTPSSEQETRSAIVERGTLLVAVSASGSVEPRTRVHLAFEVPGEVLEVQVKVGDKVERGDVLAQLDANQLALQVQQAEAALARAEAQLVQLRDGPRPGEVAAAEANVRGAEAQVNVAAANRDQLVVGASDAQIAAAEAQVAAAELQHRVTLIAHDRTFKETNDGDRREQARYDLYAADEALAAAQAQLDELLAGADADAVRAANASVAAAAAQRDAAQAQLDLLLAGSTEEQLADVEAQVAQARAALELAELSLEKTTLHAPFDGVVAAINVTAGEMASAGFTLLDASNFHMTVGVDEIDVGKLAVGQSAQITLDALPDFVITGLVERIAPAATLEGGVVTYDVVIALDPTGAPIRADMTANATIIVEELADVLKIPTWVVRVDRDTGQTYVHQRVGEEVVRTDVTLGVRHEGVAQVLSGLSEGDEAIWVQESMFGFGPQ
jgi:HlyD family secretion protein